MLKKISVLFLLFLLNSILFPPQSFAGECPIDAGGNQVQLCIGNTIEGGGRAGGGGPFYFGIRHMSEIISEAD
jgi:hypothetical protein